jgi:hypothetical protein
MLTIYVLGRKKFVPHHWFRTCVQCTCMGVEITCVVMHVVFSSFSFFSKHQKKVMIRMITLFCCYLYSRTTE